MKPETGRKIKKNRQDYLFAARVGFHDKTVFFISDDDD